MSRMQASCGYRKDGKTFILTYTVKDVDKKNISWTWENNGDQCVAQMEGTASSGVIKYHHSDPIDAAIVSQLGSPNTSKDGDFFKVKLKWTGSSSSMPDLQPYFIKT